MSNTLSLLLGLGLMALAAFGGSHADARPHLDRCAGVLHQKGEELWFGGARGEGESICVIAASQMRKVLDACAAGHYCRVAGVGGDCEGTGECLEMKSVVTVSARKAQRR
jgi:hypothetical protein